MDFTRKERHRTVKRIESDDLQALYPHNIMFYKFPPTQDISLQEFEELARERLVLLRIFEQVSLKGLKPLSDAYKEHITSELNREGLRGYLKLLQGRTAITDFDLNARRRDYISHFILRLAYCRSLELKRWFVTREMELFKYKFSALTAKEISQFLSINQMNYTPLTEDEKNKIIVGLRESTMGQAIGQIDSLDFYKVYFTEVLDLVKLRKCFLKNGYAYVNSNDFISIIAAKQQKEVEKGLEAAQKLSPEIETDERLFYLLKALHSSYTGKDYTVCKNSAIPIETLDQLSKKSFPLCMRTCHETLRAKHHHKHGGRMQYGLFLKGIGVTLEDSLRFWREEFTKLMDADKFEKSYSYNIRHNYGKEGSMVNYTPYSCLKIITASVGPQDTHGCPFKTYDISILKTKLANYGLSANHVQDVCKYTSQGHYQLACATYFEITHEVKIEQGITHPNQYFELSQEIMGNRDPKVNTSSINNQNSKKVIKKEKNTILFNAEDDDQLWNVAETQESENMNESALSKPNENEWGEELDVSQVSDMVI